MKDPILAAFLTWLVPGLGQWYQGRRSKAILFFVCIMSIFMYGVYLGGDSKLGYGRAVYCAFNNEEWRLQFLCQMEVGLPTIPAVIQALRVQNDKEVLWHGFMAPPRLISPPANSVANAGQPTLSEVNRRLNRYFELATAFTTIGGLLNILAIYDAFAGPFLPAMTKKKDESEEQEKQKKSEEGK